ncbi:MAG TPA: SAM-dependent methyltransferase [Thiobacillaceae bacterium]|nr:SAM-dependent methyltransferase [Thiobacillaceae bacterium]HNU64834.1 SAM-dependent methyltransferase [Thiobacillaceae bacterium]
MESSTRTQLPAPAPQAQAHSDNVVRGIRDEIARAGGWIPFTRYMELALYAPGLGYYAGGAAKFGAAGDFVTAPEISPLFGRSLARVMAEALAPTGGDILELGAGSGRLALDVLLELERRACLPERYLILELSPDLRARQRDLLAEAAPRLLSRVVWFDTLPERLHGVILANEVLDALPVHLVHWTAEGVRERGVAWNAAGLAWADRPVASPTLARAVARLPVTAPYLSEVNLAAPALMASLAACLEQGLILLVDYGFKRAEYYHPQRRTGTLKVHYRHHGLDDAFFLPGLADITAHVDFSAVAETAGAAGLDLLGYTGQGRFLLDAGLLELLADMTPGTPEYLRAAQAVQKLVQPHEMGELFKVMLLGRGVAHPAACRRLDPL